MHYPWKASPCPGFDHLDVAVCNEDCANRAGLTLIDELTDGWIEATANASCPGCGRLLVIEGQLTWAHYDSDDDGMRVEITSSHTPLLPA